MTHTLSPADLNHFVGLGIEDICNQSYANPKIFHCAHFVSHVLNIRTGYRCSQNHTGHGVSIRVNEVYNALAVRGRWEDKPRWLYACLIVVTNQGNVHGPTIIGSGGYKHIGIYIHDQVWHYGNTSDCVERDLLGDFQYKFRNYYGKKSGQRIVFFYGGMPA